MKFRNDEVNEVLVIENCSAKALEDKLSDLGGKIIDLQFATVKSGLTGKFVHSALVLIKRYEQ